ARGERIAVVCEKRAALDVVAQRLESLGMRHLLAVVHDVHDDRRALYNQIVERLAEGEHRDDDPVGQERTEDDYQGIVDQLTTQRKALMTSLGEERPSLGQFHLLAASFTTDPLTELDPSVVNLNPRTLKRLAGRVSREALHADLHRDDSVWRSPEHGPDRPSLADATEARLAEVQDQLRNARGTAMALSNLEEQQGVRGDEVARAIDAIRSAVATRKHRSDRARRELFAAWLARGDDPDLEPMVHNLQRAFAKVDQWETVVPEPATFAIDDETRQALTVVRSWGGSFFRFFSWSWWTARSLVRRVLAIQWPASAASRVSPQLVDRMEARQTGSVAYERLSRMLQILGMDPVISDVGTATVWVERIVETFEASRPVVESEDELREAGVWPSTERAALSRWDEQLEARLALAEALRLHQEAFASVRSSFPWIDPAPSLDVVARLHEAWALDAPRVVTSDHNLAQATALYAGARRVVEQLADQLGEPDQADESEWMDAVEHGWALTSLAQIERRHPELRVLDRTAPSDVNRAEAQLAKLVGARGEHCVQRILAAGDRVPLLTEARPEQGRKETPLQKAREQMLREANKRRYILSLRSFVRQFSRHGLMDLMPVWLLSPETMSVLFEPEPVFDLVVMDEASQCTVEKGLPALMRGHRAVIAGDDKQMPPTSFFEGKGNDDEDLGTEEQIEADALTAESLLVLARERCVHEGLRWHYRCLREELIAFSNHAMYGGDLYTIPSTATGLAAPALKWERVDDAVYDQGANVVEAERIVDLLAERLLSHDPPSMGVVTFNIQQRQVILDAIDSRIEADPAFAEKYALAVGHAELDQRPFVKNLEAVQGDERDVILFSLGHAPVTRKDGETYVPARFGPLGQAGGERRLNVAVSRAKRECIVVASFEPHMLSVGNTKHSGPKLLKAFLQYAWDLNAGRYLQATKTLERVRHGSLSALGPPEGPEAVLVEAPSLAAQIAGALDLADVAYDLDVGTSAFRVPLAVIDPRNAERYRVAVLTESGKDTGDVLESHLHEPGVLKARGWTVVRVTSRQWDQDPDMVLKRILTEAGA
ncbi:MAG: AAA domain-containing protein, partial [Myxococcota bacterium]